MACIAFDTPPLSIGRVGGATGQAYRKAVPFPIASMCPIFSWQPVFIALTAPDRGRDSGFAVRCVGVDDSSNNLLGSSVAERPACMGSPGFDPRSGHFLLFLHVAGVVYA